MHTSQSQRQLVCQLSRMRRDGDGDGGCSVWLGVCLSRSASASAPASASVGFAGGRGLLECLLGWCRWLREVRRGDLMEAVSVSRHAALCHSRRTMAGRKAKVASGPRGSKRGRLSSSSLREVDVWLALWPFVSGMSTSPLWLWLCSDERRLTESCRGAVQCSAVRILAVTRRGG